jgi:hypothetical protein
MQLDAALDTLLDGGRGAIDSGAKIYGLVPAIVKAVNDTSSMKRHKMGMVQVFFPWLQADDDKHKIMPWARVCMQGTGGGSGFFTVPQVGDEVCVAFEHGDIHFPYVLGTLWNGRDRIPSPTTAGDSMDCKGHGKGAPTHKTPDLGPESICGDKGSNKVYFWRSRTGHLIAMDDKEGTVRITDRTGKSAIQLEKDEVKILQRDKDISFSIPGGKIHFDCTDFVAQASAKINMKAGKNININAKQNVTMMASGQCQVIGTAGLGCESKNNQLTMAAASSISAITPAAFGIGGKSVKINGQGGVNMIATGAFQAGADQKVSIEANAAIMISTPAELVAKAGGAVNVTAAVVLLN